MANHDKLSAVFVKGIRGTDSILSEDKPQIAFIGRSNVGKSSLINSLVDKELARSSSNPGKTINIDFFLVNNEWYFVDLPGYGFAKVSKERHDHFRKLIAWYLFSAGVHHKLVVLIIDTVVGLTDFDRESIALFNEYHTPFVIVANKLDKLKAGERQTQLAEIQRECGIVPVIPYSSVTKEGKKELLKFIFKP